MDMKELRESIDWYFKQKGMRIFDKSIQAESIDQMGWLLYSNGKMDLVALKDAIDACLSVTIGLRYKYINTASYEPDRNARKKWMAVHIEADSKEAKKVERGLKKLYGTASTAFPLGIRMRLVSEYRLVKGNPTNSAKHTRLRIRQANFLQMIKGCPADDIAQLDYKVAALDNTSLREMIMAIVSTNPTTPGPLYHSVGLDWKGRFMLTFLAHKEDEAIMIADGIIPYIIHHHGNKASSFFDPDALLDKQDWRWDTKTLSIVNPLTEELEGLETLDTDFVFDMAVVEAAVATAKPTDTNEGPTAQELAIAKMNVLVNDRDQESVSTMGNDPRSIAGRLISMSPAKSGTASVLSNASYETRFTAIDDRITSMESNIKDAMKELVREVMGARPPMVDKEGPNV